MQSAQELALSNREPLVLKAAHECKKIITCEEHSIIIGGLGEAVCAVVAEHGLPCPVVRVGVKVLSKDRIRVYLRGGMEAEQTIDTEK